MHTLYLIDLENVQSAGLEGVELLSEDDYVLVFYSNKADNLKIDLVKKIKDSPAEVDYIKADNGTPNALDFQLITYLFCHLTAADQFWIVSKDTGYDASIKMCRRLDVKNVRRAPAIKNALHFGVRAERSAALKTARSAAKAVTDEKAADDKDAAATLENTAEEKAYITQAAATDAATVSSDREWESPDQTAIYEESGVPEASQAIQEASDEADVESAADELIGVVPLPEAASTQIILDDKEAATAADELKGVIPLPEASSTQDILDDKDAATAADDTAGVLPVPGESAHKHKITELPSALPDEPAVPHGRISRRHTAAAHAKKDIVYEMPSAFSVDEEKKKAPAAETPVEISPAEVQNEQTRETGAAAESTAEMQDEKQTPESKTAADATAEVQDKKQTPENETAAESHAEVMREKQTPENKTAADATAEMQDEKQTPENETADEAKEAQEMQHTPEAKSAAEIPAAKIPPEKQPRETAAASPSAAAAVPHCEITPEKMNAVVALLKRECEVELDDKQKALIAEGLEKCENKNQFYHFFRKRMGGARGSAFYKSIRSQFTAMQKLAEA